MFEKVKVDFPPYCIDNGWVDPYPHLDAEHSCTLFCCERPDPQQFGAVFARYPYTCEIGVSCTEKLGRKAWLRSKGECILCSPETT